MSDDPSVVTPEHIATSISPPPISAVCYACRGGLGNRCWEVTTRRADSTARLTQFVCENCFRLDRWL